MFKTIQSLVASQYATIEKYPLFVVDLGRSALYEKFIDSLPEELHQQHNCSCCRSFLRRYGNVVGLDDAGNRYTVWDFIIDNEYSLVPKALAEIVHSAKIVGEFFPNETVLGVKSNVGNKLGVITTWDHFYVKNTGQVYQKGTRSDSSLKRVAHRALTTISVSALDTVLAKINDNSLHRGSDKEEVLTLLKKHIETYDTLSDSAKEAYVWKHYRAIGRIRNTAIGTLLVDLSEGVDLNLALSTYSKKVSAENYMQSTTLHKVSSSAVDNAQKTLIELGLLSALKRRYATYSDIPVSNVLYVNRNHQTLDNDPFSTVKKSLTVDAKKLRNVVDITLDDLLSLLPQTTSLEVLFTSGSAANLMSLTTAVDDEANQLFAWSNNVAWVYRNGFADSIKEKVKAAGGNTVGVVRASLHWFNTDDLDLNILEPDGNIIYYGAKVSKKSGGALDVDMNRATTDLVRGAVENIVYTSKHRMFNGKYIVRVNNYAKRENVNFGFILELEIEGNIRTFKYSEALPTGKTVDVATFNLTGSGKFEVEGKIPELDGPQTSKICGVETGKFAIVSMVLNSPNYWTEEKGNKHLFMILPDAVNDSPVKGIFPEFLKPSLTEHRKVFELLANNDKLEPSVDKDQLTGLGFSYTQRNDFIVRINGHTTYKVSV